MSVSKVDFKKIEKNLYNPPTRPVMAEVPEMSFLMVDGSGDPNDEKGEYQKAVEMLYTLSYTIKMSKKGSHPIDHYFEYVVPPLEGLWWTENPNDLSDKKHFLWTAMIRQPSFVNEEAVKWAKEEASRKKPSLDFTKVYLSVYKEGRTVQMMHIGSYDTEQETFKQMEEYMVEHQLQRPLTCERKHHEIYLSDPRRTRTDRLKTIIRLPVEPMEGKA